MVATNRVPVVGPLRLPWYKRQPREMLALYRQLGPEAGGMFSALVDLCCQEGGPVEDNDKLIAGTLGVDVRIWKRVRGKLVAAGRLYECRCIETGGPALSSGIAEKIIADGRKRWESAKRAGDISAQLAAEKRAETGSTSAVDSPDLKDKSGEKSDIDPFQNNKLNATPVGRPLVPNRVRNTKEDSGDAILVGEALNKLESVIIQKAISDGQGKRERDASEG